MAQLLNSKRKLCIVKNNGPLHELGGISGPILAPCQLSMRAIINMVQNGRNVYEVNPKNMKETVKLNIKNVQLNNFPEPQKFVLPEDKKAPVKPEVVKKENNIEAKQTNIGGGPVKEERLDTIVKEAQSTSSENVNEQKESVSEQKSSWENKKDKNHGNDFKKK